MLSTQSDINLKSKSTLTQEIIHNAKSTKRIAVVYAGSKEDEGRVLYPNWTTRSWKSYQAVAEDIAVTLQELGFQHVNVYPEGVDLLSKLEADKIDLVWINSGGVQGRNPVSHLPALLEMAGIPYVGHHPTNATVLDNKHLFKWGLAAKSIPTASFFAWNGLHAKFEGPDNEKFKRNFGDYQGPFIVKPVNGRGSVMVEYVEDINALTHCVNDICASSHNAVIVEKYLSGEEYTVAVMPPLTYRGDDLELHEYPVSFSFTRRKLEEDEKVFTSMDLRPITSDRLTVLCPETHKDVCTQLAKIAKEVYTSFNLETLIRLDVRADHQGKIHVLEANPKPDLKKPVGNKTNLVCSGLAHLGMTYNDLIQSLLAASISLYSNDYQREK